MDLNKVARNALTICTNTAAKLCNMFEHVDTASRSFDAATQAASDADIEARDTDLSMRVLFARDVIASALAHLMLARDLGADDSEWRAFADEAHNCGEWDHMLNVLESLRTQETPSDSKPRMTREQRRQVRRLLRTQRRKPGTGAR